MASRTVSPGAALLRSSRMFSMPAPLPRPQNGIKAGSVAESDTATTHHPTHLAVSAPASSIAQGDWGFKRPLPIRTTTNTSTPTVRIEKIDTWDHITDFRTAAGHALNLEKFQEMNLTITVPAADQGQLVYARQGSTKSVFEKDFDDVSTPNRPAGKRWKFDGPWLATMPEAEFNAYLARVVKNRRNEFTAFLREQLAKKLNDASRQAAIEKSQEPPQAVSAASISEDQLFTWVRELRHTRRDLMEYIRSFLDLAPAPPAIDEAKYQDILFSAKGDVLTSSESPYAKSGPPKTHPSAGLSYNRTSAYIENHPQFGPQEHHQPIQARVLAPRTATRNGAKMGVAGFVTNVPAGLDSHMAHKQGRRGAKGPIPGISWFDPDREGGHKFWVHPVSAVVDSVGAVKLEVISGEPQAVAVKTGDAATKHKAPLNWFYSKKPNQEKA